MTSKDLEKYFDGMDNKYYDSSILISILEKIIGKNISEIKNDVNNAQISVTKDEIVDFLEKTFQEDDPKLKDRIENPKQIKIQRDEDESAFTSRVIEEVAQGFVDDLAAERYRFEPFTLEYFNNYSSIVRNKALQLLDVIEKIGTKESFTIQELLTELDIILDENGNITREDITRLIIPTIQNIEELEEKVTQANDLTTYLTFKMSEESLYREGWSARELYPTKAIIVNNLINGYSYGNVPISCRQEQALREEFKKGDNIVARILTKLN